MSSDDRTPPGADDPPAVSTPTVSTPGVIDPDLWQLALMLDAMTAHTVGRKVPTARL